MKQQNDQIIDPNPFSKLKEFHVLKGHMGRITAINICEQKNLLVSGSLDKTVKIWNLQDGTLLKTFQFSYIILTAVLSSQGNFIACGGGDFIINLIELKDFNSNDIVSELNEGKIIQNLCFSKDQIYLVSGDYDSTVRVRSVQTKQELCKFEVRRSIPQIPIKFQIRSKQYSSLIMSRDNRLIALRSTTKGIKIWDFKIKKLLCQHKGNSIGYGITFSNDEKMLISSGIDGKVNIWSLSKLYQGKLSLVKQFQVTNHCLKRILITQDSKFIVLYCSKNIKVIDSNTGEIVKQFHFKNIHKCSIVRCHLGGVAITKRMDMIAFGDDNDLSVWKSGL